MLQVVRTAKSVSTLSSITMLVGRLQIEDNSYFPYAVANWRSYLWLKYWNKLAETILIGGLYTRPIRVWVRAWVCCHLVITPLSSGEKLAHDCNQVLFLTHLLPFPNSQSFILANIQRIFKILPNDVCFCCRFDNWIEHMTTMVFSFQQSCQIIDNVQ